MSGSHTRRRLTPWLGWTAAVLAMALFTMLGFWQLGRAKQKEAMLADVQAVLTARAEQPLSLAGDAKRARNYDWAAGEGAFVDTPAILLDGQQREGRVGVRIYRLFQPVGARPLLIDLGWLPLPGDRALPRIELPLGNLRLQGLLSPPPAHGMLAIVAKQQGDVVLTTGMEDRPQLAQSLKVDALPRRVLKLDPELKLGYARDLDVLPNTLPPEKHLGYAVQWFGLALAVLVTAVLLTIRQWRREREKMPA